MRNDMRPELSQKNPYWIGKHRYYELKHFCLQYPIWKKARLALDGLSRRPADLQVFVSCGQVKGDPTERCAQSRIFFGERMEMVEQAAIEAEPDLYSYLLRGVTEGLSYDALKILKDAGLPHIRFHDLQHTFATTALQNGVDVKTVSSMLGHFDAGFTLRTYTHATRQKQDEAAQILRNLMEQVM